MTRIPSPRAGPATAAVALAGSHESRPGCHGTAGLRAAFDLGALVTLRHFDLLGQMLLLTGLATLYAYLIEPFIAWYSRDPNEIARVIERWSGPYAAIYWLTLGLNFLPIQALWWRRLRCRVPVMVGCGVAVALGMYGERFMLLITTLVHGFLPGMWRLYVPTLWDWGLTFGTFGIFMVLMLLFVRFLPLIAIAEIKETLHEEQVDLGARHGG